MKWIVVMGSAAGHLAAVLGLDQLAPHQANSAPTAITVVEAPAPVEPEKAPEPEPEPEPTEAPPVKAEAVAPSPLARSAAPTAEPAAPSADALPDLGLELSGTGSAGPGLAVARIFRQPVCSSSVVPWPITTISSPTRFTRSAGSRWYHPDAILSSSQVFGEISATRFSLIFSGWNGLIGCVANSIRR